MARARHNKINLLNHLVGFCRVLHKAGVRVSSANLIDLCRSMDYIDIGQRDEFYAAARTTLISNHGDLTLFDDVFSQYWEQQDLIRTRTKTRNNSKAEQNPRQSPSKAGRQQKNKAGKDAETQAGLSPYAYSAKHLLLRKDFGQLSLEEMQQARHLIKPLVEAIASYKSRRSVPSKKTVKLDFRRMLRRSAISDQTGIKLEYRKRRIKKNKLVLLCDISGSMERYSDFFIQFIYALGLEIADFEVAVFSTRMTVITKHLGHADLKQSLQQVSQNVHNWAGGTDIGASLREFNDCYADDMLHSRSVVIILSDGWDRGDAYLMREEIAHLRRRSHKLIWLNPLLGHEAYQPLCRGMQTALPYLDYFLAVNNLHSLNQIAKTLRTAWR